MTLSNGASIRIKPATFKRVPFNRLTHLRGKVGRVLRAAHRRPDKTLWEIEVEGVVGLCWEGELREVGTDGRQ